MFGFPYFAYTPYTGHEIKGNDHQKLNVLMLKPILSTSTKENIWKTVRRTFMLINWGLTVKLKVVTHLRDAL